MSVIENHIGSYEYKNISLKEYFLLTNNPFHTVCRTILMAKLIYSRLFLSPQSQSFENSKFSNMYVLDWEDDQFCTKKIFWIWSSWIGTPYRRDFLSGSQTCIHVTRLSSRGLGTWSLCWWQKYTVTLSPIWFQLFIPYEINRNHRNARAGHSRQPLWQSEDGCQNIFALSLYTKWQLSLQFLVDMMSQKP